MELMQTLRKIRACEGDAAAQLLLEAFVAQEVAAERERCAKLCDDKFDELNAKNRGYHSGYENGAIDAYDMAGRLIRGLGA